MQEGVGLCGDCHRAPLGWAEVIWTLIPFVRPREGEPLPAGTPMLTCLLLLCVSVWLGTLTLAANRSGDAPLGCGQLGPCLGPQALGQGQ